MTTQDSTAAPPKAFPFTPTVGNLERWRRDPNFGGSFKVASDLFLTEKSGFAGLAASYIRVVV